MVFLVGHGPVHEFEDAGVLGKSLCTRRLTLQDIRKCQKVIARFKRYDNQATVDINQNITTITYVRFKVTTCLYLSPNNGARSLFTLIALAVSKDTEDKL